MLRPSIEPCWTDALVPLAARGVLPGLPPLSSLRHAVSDALPRSASNSASDGSALVFPASALLEAVEGCVESTAAIPAPARPAACLFIASLAMEQHVKAHSTKARLMRLPPINNSNVGGGRQPAAAGGLPPLRPYQADVVGMVAFSWGLALTSQLLLLPPAGGTGAATAAQAAAAATASERYSRLADDWEGNWLVMARTGSGKTRMFIEIARYVRMGPCVRIGRDYFHPARVRVCAVKFKHHAVSSVSLTLPTRASSSRLQLPSPLRFPLAAPFPQTIAPPALSLPSIHSVLG